MAKQVQVKPTEIPEGWSEESADFINRVKKLIYNINVLIIHKKKIIVTSKKTNKSTWIKRCSGGKGPPLVEILPLERSLREKF